MKSKESFFVRQLKKAMIDKNLNQKDLGKLIGVNQQMISRWLTGSYSPAFSSLQKIAKALNVPVNYLMDESQENKISQSNKDTNMLQLNLLEEKIKRYEAENKLASKEIDILKKQIKSLEDKFKSLEKKIEK